MTEPLTLMIVSDLHATSKPPGDEAGSWITTTTVKDEHHPLTSLRGLVDREGLDIDLLLCGGDITNKADSSALISTWSDLNELAAAIGATLIATAGNHDLDSRHTAEIDPRGVMFDLEPLFPTASEDARASFWSKNYAVVDGPLSADGEVEWRVVAVNSSAFHGFSTESGDELDFGRISQRTTRRLEAELQGMPAAKIQVLLLHHHVEQLPDVDLDEPSRVREVEHLLALLERTGPWLVVHGHKHRPYVHYAHGGGGSAAILSAASLSAYSWGQLSTQGPQNQVHVLHIEPDSRCAELGLGLAIRFESWSWRPGVGWARASGDGGLPGRGGFGWRVAPNALARQLAGLLSDAQPSLDREQLIAHEPKLMYVAPIDQRSLVDELDRRDVAATVSADGDILEIRMKLQPPVGGLSQDER